VRYNAEKKKVGNYYTTPVYRFRMKCHLCVNYIELQTDPGSCDYVIVSGARRKEERWEPGDSGQLLPTSPEQRQRLATDAMFRLEHGVSDRGGPGARHAHPDAAAGGSERLEGRLRPQQPPQEEVPGGEEDAAGGGGGGRRRWRGRPGSASPCSARKRRIGGWRRLLSLRAPDSYEERQRLKRSEISQRSWFGPGTSRTPPKNPNWGWGRPHGHPRHPPRPRRARHRPPPFILIYAAQN
ncbi:unnamed protein product, partial [Coccothraustes coccothraustes]